MSNKRNVIFFVSMLLSLIAPAVFAQDVNNGLNPDLSNIFMLSNAKTRSLSAENPTGEKGKGGMATTGISQGAARELGQGWKVNPCAVIKGGETYTIADLSTSGSIQHIWMTPTGNWRFLVLRIYWDDEAEPSVEVPLGDFFCMGWGKYAPVNSLPVTVNPGSAFNSYWPMPFRKHCRMTVQNLDKDNVFLFYQIDYTETEVPKDAAYFHAQFRRSNPTQGAIHTLLDNVSGKGQYVGTYMAIGVTNNGWWGEGKIKFYMDGDTKFPTINGTGTEDYFLGSYDFEDPVSHQYDTFTTPYSGLAQVIKPDGLYVTQERFGLYRWHIQDPIRFEKNLKVTIQDLGWRSGGRYLQQHSDISTVSFWYQTEPHNPFPKFPTKDELEVN
jgi:hypothetical protein